MTVDAEVKVLLETAHDLHIPLSGVHGPCRHLPEHGESRLIRINPDNGSWRAQYRCFECGTIFNVRYQGGCK